MQTQLARNGRGGGTTVRNRHGAILKGLLRCQTCDCAMPDQMLYQRIRSQAVHRFEIVDEAHDLWKILKHPALDCTVFFSNQVVLGKKHQKPLSDLIFLRILDSHERVLGEGLSAIIEDDLPPEIVKISVRKSLPESNPVWQCQISGVVHERCIEMFQAAIDRKHDRLRNYLNFCQECWLVLLTTWEYGAIEPDETTLCHRFTTPFQRVYFVDLCGQKVVRLHIDES